MKLFFSFFLLLISHPLWAGPITLFYEQNHYIVDVVKNWLIKDYQIPEQLISQRSTNGKKCDELRSSGLLDWCINSNGDLLLVSMDEIFVTESLKIFRK